MTSGEGSLGRAYRQLFSSNPVRALLGRVVTPERVRAGHEFPMLPKSQGRRVWFHAASVGELEGLWPVARLWAEAGGEVLLTNFSDSATSALARLGAELDKIGDGRRILYRGFSPLEGAWRKAAESLKPDVFVTSKYECWPDLWAALAELEVPLVVTGARPRRSLRVAALASRVLQGQPPPLRFLCVDEEDARALEAEFPGSRASRCGDPRWDRVRERALADSPRAREVAQSLGALPRPWGVLGSAWLSDLEVWKEFLAGVRGTLWVVPHRIDAASVAEIERFLRANDRKPLRTSGLVGRGSAGMLDGRAAPAVLVDEMGFLLELYGSAEWAYVGGGFEAGVHSTIEPAIRGIPIVAGPKRATRFPEIAELARDGQLALVADSRELGRWLEARELVAPPGKPRTPGGTAPSTTFGAASDSASDSASNSDSDSASASASNSDSDSASASASAPAGAKSDRERWLASAERRYGASRAVFEAIDELVRH